jgi:hypothetical protein
MPGLFRRTKISGLVELVVQADLDDVGNGVPQLLQTSKAISTGDATTESALMM